MCEVHFNIIGFRIIYDTNCHIIDCLSAPWVCAPFLSTERQLGLKSSDKLIIPSPPSVINVTNVTPLPEIRLPSVTLTTSLPVRPGSLGRSTFKSHFLLHCHLEELFLLIYPADFVYVVHWVFTQRKCTPQGIMLHQKWQQRPITHLLRLHKPCLQILQLSATKIVLLSR